MTDYPEIDEKLIDNIIKEFEKYDETNLHSLLSGITHRNIGYTDAEFLSKIDEKLSKEYKYADATCKGYHYYRLTEIGKEAKNQGGHIEYTKKLKEKSISDKDRQTLNDEKLRYDVKNAKRIFKTYWWTFCISIFGFLSALGKIIYDIVKAE